MNLTVIGWPRSGTHWLQEMLRRATGLDVLHSHAIPDSADEENRYVFIIRDPRDAFVSHYQLYLHDHPGTQRTQMEHLELFFKGKGMAQPYFHLGWADHTRLLQETACLSPFIKTTRHESLVDGTRAELDRILHRHRIFIDGWRIEDAVKAVSGIRCDPSDLPPEDMGAIGKHKKVLEREVLASLWDYCGDIAEGFWYQREEE